MIVLGLCCINETLQKRCKKDGGPVKCRVVIRDRYSLERAVELCRLNLTDLYTLLQWNQANSIFSFRIGSDLLPHYTDTDPRIVRYDMAQFQQYFTAIGEFARTANIRLSFHPGQFTVLSSDDPTVLTNSFNDLAYHCEMLYRMGVSPIQGVCNIHGGGLYGLPKDVIKRRWADNYLRLPPYVRAYLTLENCEKSYNLQDCLDISALCGVAVVYDTHHEECYRYSHPNETYRPLEEMLDDVIKTWYVATPPLGGEPYWRWPMAHVSNQRYDDGKIKRLGAHSDYIERFPEILWHYAAKVGTLYVDVEAKRKEAAVFALRAQYPGHMT